MKKIYLLIVLITSICKTGFSQIFPVDTIQWSGDPSKYINIVIMGDGYTSTMQAKFKSDAKKLSDYMFTQTPFKQYKNYFNVVGIGVVSADSGAKHPNTAPDCNSANPTVPVSAPNTYFGCTFDYFNIHRLITPINTSNIAMVLAQNFPAYDQTIIISSSPYYGGSGGAYATSSTETTSPEIVAHEVGHSFASLSDEYYAGDVYAGEKINMTKETNPTLVRWKNWIGSPGIGIYQHCCGGSSAQWYKPSSNSCKMQLLGVPYCSVCQEAIVEKIHQLTNPIVKYTPDSGSVNTPQSMISFRLIKLMKPIDNTLNITWTLDGVSRDKNKDSIIVNQTLLSAGKHYLTATIIDTSSLVRTDNHPTLHFSKVSWTITRNKTGVNIISSDNKVDCSIFPNPSSDIMNYSIVFEKPEKFNLQVISIDGKLVHSSENVEAAKGDFKGNFNISDLPAGTYSVIFKFGNSTHTETFVKE
ncbi:MAG: T9SS type A sorting domain-containing protein [Bacteroidia bacterium]|nr:T9SS type A sorting domain-containing protein [Bacteroidia bacterium]